MKQNREERSRKASSQHSQQGPTMMLQCGHNHSAHRNQNYSARLHWVCRKMHHIEHSPQQFTLLTSLLFSSCISSFSISPPHLNCHTKDWEGLGQLTSSLRPMSVTTISKADTVLDIFGYIIGIIAEVFPHKTYTYTTHHLFPFTLLPSKPKLFSPLLFF